MSQLPSNYLERQVEETKKVLCYAYKHSEKYCIIQVFLKKIKIKKNGKKIETKTL